MYVLFLLKWNFSPYVDSNVHYIETFENRSDTLHMPYTGIRAVITIKLDHKYKQN